MSVQNVSLNKEGRWSKAYIILYSDEKKPKNMLTYVDISEPAAAVSVNFYAIMRWTVVRYTQLMHVHWSIKFFIDVSWFHEWD